MELIDQLSSIFRDAGVLYSKGYRCRYDPEYMQRKPLKSDEEYRVVDHCLGCKYTDKIQDPYCSTMIRSWNVIISDPNMDENKYSCTCPNVPCSSKL